MRCVGALNQIYTPVGDRVFWSSLRLRNQGSMFRKFPDNAPKSKSGTFKKGEIPNYLVYIRQRAYVTTLSDLLHSFVVPNDALYSTGSRSRLMA